jgi:hypothetical protein
MARSRLSMVAGLLAVVALSACTTAEASKEADAPAQVERIEGTTLSRVTFTARAAERLGITLVPIAAVGGASRDTVVPYAALIYDPDGRTWVYTSTKPRTYERAAVSVARIEGDRAFLSTSPPAGTQVVSVGVAEVYGTELFSEHE